MAETTASLGRRSRAEIPEHRREDFGLVTRIAAGDCAAFSRLYDRHSRILLAIAVRTLGDRSDAEEILQETFFYVWRRAGSYDPMKASVWSWMSLILRSRCIDRLRNAKANRERAAAVKREIETSEAPVGLSGVLREQRAGRVRSAIRLLPEAQRRVLELCYFRGLTQSQVAVREEIPLGTVKTRTLLAMRKLRRELGPEVAALI